MGANETGQIYVGQTGGLMISTRTQHRIKFMTYADQTGVGTVQISIQILKSGTRDVQILAPLKVFDSFNF